MGTGIVDKLFNRRRMVQWAWRAAVVCGLVFLATSCGKAPEKFVGPAGGKVTLAVFGATWCSECKSDLPAIQALLDKLPKAQRDAIDFQLYVTTGGNANNPPTQSDADTYKASLHVDATANPDPWKWKTFKQYVGGKLALPGAAVLSADGTVLQSYRAGATSFVPSEIVGFAVQSIQ